MTTPREVRLKVLRQGVTATAQELGCSRQAVYAALRRDPLIVPAINVVRDETVSYEEQVALGAYLRRAAEKVGVVKE